MSRLSVTVVGGFLGAGKTSVVNQLIAGHQDRRVAVIVNHLKELTLDMPWRRQLRVAPNSDVAEVIVLEQGCITHGRAQELVQQITRLAQENLVDAVIVEASGIADLTAIARLFSPECEHGDRLPRVADLAGVVTVVDGQRFFDDYCSNHRLNAHGLVPGERGLQHVAWLLAEQIEAADRLVIAKAEQMTSGQFAVLQATLREMNPTARILRHPPLAVALPRRQALLMPSADPPRCAPEHSISSFVFQSRRPFHPERLRAHFLREWPGVLRSRGTFWLATRMSEVGSWSLAGSAWQIMRAGFWWAALPKHLWPRSPEHEAEILENWQEPYGDRRQDITVIGLDLDESRLRAQFDGCLLSDAELHAGPTRWAGLTDPFAAWDEVIHWQLGTPANQALH